MITANSFIHLVMYYYYLVASFGSSPAWGRYLTMMQMVQFMAMNAQAVYLLYYGCEYPPRLLLTYFLYVLSLLALFAQFYIRKHCSRREGGKKAD